MAESRQAQAVVVESRYRDAVARTLEAADESSEPVRAGIEAAISMAELNPEGAREALWRLLTDWDTLEELEERLLEQRLGDEPTWAALRIGAVIQIARAELASPDPQLRRRLPEILEWLNGGEA